MIHVIHNEEIEEVRKKDGLCLIDFFATWCGPCKMLSPVLEELSENYAGKVDFYKVDIDGNQDLAMQYGVEAVPTVVFIKQGKVISKFVGYHGMEEVKEMIDNML